MTLDRELVTRKLLLITADLDPLRQIHNRGVDAFLGSTIDQAVVECLLERAITVRLKPDTTYCRHRLRRTVPGYEIVR